MQASICIGGEGETWSFNVEKCKVTVCFVNVTSVK